MSIIDPLATSLLGLIEEKLTSEQVERVLKLLEKTHDLESDRFFQRERELVLEEKKLALDELREARLQAKAKESKPE